MASDIGALAILNVADWQLWILRQSYKYCKGIERFLALSRRRRWRFTRA
jgi:hypothetical protein